MADQLNTQWTKIIGKTTYSGFIEEIINIASAISTASDGSSYVVGYASKARSSQNVAYITKYNHNGVREWTKQQKLNNSYSTVAHSVSTAIDGSIYMVGSRDATIPEYPSRTGIKTEAYVVKYNSDGSEAWATLVGLKGGFYGEIIGNQAFSVSAFSDGSVYVAGVHKDTIYSEETSFISKLSSNGSILWTKGLSPTEIHTSVSFREIKAQSVSAASDGSVYVVGLLYTHRGNTYEEKGEPDAFITKFNSDGSEAWSNLLGAATQNETYSVCTASDGSIYISGGATTYKYNSNGIKAWERSNGLGHASSSVSVTKDGSIYVAGTTIDPNYLSQKAEGSEPVPKGGRIGAKDAFITKFYSDGSSERTLIYGTNKDDSVSSIIAALDGSIFTVGSTNANIEYWTTGYGKNELTQGFQVHMGGSYISKFNSNPYQGEIRTYTLNPSVRTISEAGTIPYFPGSSAYKNAELTILGETTNVPEGTTIFYTLGGKGIDFSDFSQQWLGSDTNPISPLNTPFPLKINENGHFSFKLFLEGDGIKEGDETLEIKLFSDDLKSHQLGLTDTVLITDSYSRATGWLLGTSSKFIDEGDTFYTTFGAYNKLGAEFYYSLSGNGITAADFSTGGLTGSGTIANAFPMNGSFWFSHTVASDLTNEGTETIEIKIFSDAARTKQVGSTASVSITDTSITPVVNNTGTTAFSISGKGDIGSQLSIIKTKDDPEGNGKFTYKWQSSVDGINWTNLAAISSSYTVAASDASNQLRASISYLDGKSNSESVDTSALSIAAVASTKLTAGDFATPVNINISLPAYIMSSNWNIDKYYYYVEQYPMTLRTAFYADYLAGRYTNEALYGQNHYLTGGQAEGRSMPGTDGILPDSNDYGAYVENYGITLLDIYRVDSRAVVNGGTMSLFAWGKEHYTNWGKAEGREISGGVEWGGIVRNNLDVYNQWQDAKIVNPTLSAFAFGYQRQNTIKSTLGVLVGSDTADKLTGQIAYGLNGNDVICSDGGRGILAGGFGDDLLVAANGGSDLAYGGPGSDIFQLNAGSSFNIRDFRKGADMIQLGSALTSSGVTTQWDSADNSTLFYNGSSVIGKVYGKRPTEFTYSDSTNGVSKVYI